MADKHVMTFTAGPNIRASRVVKMYGGADFSVAECGTGLSEVPFGIAQNHNEGTPGTPFDTGFAASAGKQIMVWAPGATAIAAVQQEAQSVAAGLLVGPNPNSEIIAVQAGWAVGWLLETTSPTFRWRLRVYVHPMRLSAGSTS